MRRFTRLSSALIVVVLASGCGSGLRVTAIQLGKSLNTDGSVANHTTIFSRSDTVYLSVETAGVGSGTMSTRWMYGNLVLSEPKKKVSYRDVAITEFHLQSADGFPPGEYTVEAFLDGQSIGKRSFRVQD